MGTIKEEHVMRVEVTGGFVEVFYVHDMSAEDTLDLISYLEVFRKHLLKRIATTYSKSLPDTLPGDASKRADGGCRTCGTFHHGDCGGYVSPGAT